MHNFKNHSYPVLISCSQVEVITAMHM